MCWETRKTPIKKIAESDLKVYKILSCIENRIVSPIKHEFAWELNKTYKTELDSPDYCGRISIITLGFHSLLDFPKLRRTVFFRIPLFTEWRIKSHTVMLYTIGDYVFDAVIPKGSEYYENEYGEMVSNQLEIIGKCAS